MNFVADDSVMLSIDHLTPIQDVLWTGRKKWRNIGLQLGMSMDDLDVIQLDNPYQTGNCFTKMLTIWLQRKKQTLGSLIAALRSPPVGLGQLAEELAGIGEELMHIMVSFKGLWLKYYDLSPYRYKLISSLINSLLQLCNSSKSMDLQKVVPLKFFNITLHYRSFQYEHFTH